MPRCCGWTAWRSKYVEEVGAMNIFFKIDGKIYTARLRGHRSARRHPPQRASSCCKDWGYEVIEGKLAIAD